MGVAIAPSAMGTAAQCHRAAAGEVDRASPEPVEQAARPRATATRLNDGRGAHDRADLAVRPPGGRGAPRGSSTIQAWNPACANASANASRSTPATRPGGRRRASSVCQAAHGDASDGSARGPGRQWVSENGASGSMPSSLMRRVRRLGR